MRTLAAALLSVISLTSFAEPFPLRGELPVSAPEFAPVREPMTDARIASNGEGYAAIWTDFRGTEPRAYAARFKQDGTRLDPLGIHITPADFSGTIVWSGSAYLLIYGEGVKLYSRTLSTDGFLGTPAQIFDRVNDDAPIHFAAASNGTNILLVTDAGMPSLLLDLQGNKLREISFPWGFAFRGIDVKSAGGKYLVAAGNEQLHTISVAGDGTTGAMTTIATLPVTSNVSIATDGAKHFVVWSRTNVEGQAFDANGNAIGDMRALTTDGGIANATVAWRGGEYFVTFTEEYTRALYGLRVSADGVALSTPQRTTSKSKFAAALGTIGESGVALWRPLYGGLEAAFFDAQTVTAADPFRPILPLADAAQKQFDIHLARLVNGGLVAAWLEQTDTTSEVRASRGPGSVPVVASPLDMQRLIDVVVEGNVVWILSSYNSTIYVQRLNELLQAIDAEPVSVASDAYGDPAFGVATGGDGTVMLVYQKRDAQEQFSDVTALQLRADGSGIATKKFDLPSGAHEDHTPAVVYDGVNFVIAWARGKTKPSDDFGAPAPADQIVEVSIVPSGIALPPVVAFDSDSAVQTLLGARNGKATTFIWQTADDLAPTMRFKDALSESAQTRTLDISDSARIVGLEAHGDGFVLAAATSTFARKFTMQELELFTLAPFSGFGDTTTVGTFEVSDIWRSPDIDLAGGPSLALAYTRLGSDAEYGGVTRVFVQQTTNGRRRVVR